MKKNLTFCISLLAFITSQQVIGNDLPEHYKDDMQEHGIEEVSRFDAPGATGYLLLDPTGQMFTAYALESNESVIVGTMYDAEGADLSSEVLNNYSLQLLESSDLWFSRGNPEAPYVYVVDDPMCPYCHQQYEVLKNAVDEGKLQIRHLLVGILGEQSQQKANKILESDDPSATFEEHHARFDEGGIEGIAPNYNQKQRIETHNELMYQLGVRGTPAIFYRDSEGNSHRVGGFTEDVASIFQRLGIE